MTLADALQNLQPLSHDELTDLIDLMDYWNDVEGVHQRRKGKNSIEVIERYAGNELRQAIRSVRYLKKKSRPHVYTAAVMLRNALAPLEFRKRTQDGYVLAQGTLQVKYIPRPKFNFDTQQMEIVNHGPYLYLRVWATGGGRDRREKRLKNKYIGHKKLAIAFEEGRVTAEQIMRAYHRRTLDDLEKELLGGESILPNDGLE